MTGIIFQESQSEYFGRMDDKDLQNSMDGEALKAFERASTVFKPEPIFPEGEDKILMLFGLDDVLLKINGAIEAKYKIRTVEALKELLPKDAVIDEQQVHDLVHKSYEEFRLPSRHVAQHYNVDETMLMTSTLNLVAYQDIALNPAAYGTGDQGLLNYFHAAVHHHNIVPALVTSSTTNFGITALHFSALKQYFGNRVYGMDAYSGAPRKVLRKNRDAHKVLDNLLEGVAPERMGKVIAVDHNRAFLAAVQERGGKAVYLDPSVVDDAQATFNTGVTALHASSVQAMFEHILKIKNPGSHRDSHVYAGIGSFRPSEA